MVVRDGKICRPSGMWPTEIAHLMSFKSSNVVPGEIDFTRVRVFDTGDGADQ